jgi:hypothetical protein
MVKAQKKPEIKNKKMQTELELRQYVPKGWEMVPTPHGLTLKASSEEEARAFWKGAKRSLARTAQNIATQILIAWDGCTNPLSVAPHATDIEQGGLPPEDVFGMDYMRLLEKLQAWRSEGKIVIITSNTSNICLHTNDLLTPARATWTAAQFHGYDYLRSWRADMGSYEQLKKLLAREKYVPSFEYELYRPNGDRCSYQTDFFLCRNYCGDEVRIGVSEVGAYSVVREREVAAV